MAQSYPTARYPHDQPQVNALTDYARQCAGSQNYSNNATMSLQFSQAFQQIYLLTGLPAHQLVSHFNSAEL